MGEELTIFEQLGGSYIEKNGLLYPVFDESTIKSENVWVGKYGHMWMGYVKGNYPERYRNLFRRGMLEVKASEINAEACGLLDTISEQYIKREILEGCDSTMDMWKLREQARQLAEELVLQEVIFMCYENAHCTENRVNLKC